MTPALAVAQPACLTAIGNEGIGPDGEIIHPQVWESYIKPDMAVLMAIWPLESPLSGSGNISPPSLLPPDTERKGFAEPDVVDDAQLLPEIDRLFMATIVDFFYKSRFQKSHSRKVNVDDLLKDPLYANNIDTTTPSFRWLHLPANNVGLASSLICSMG